MVLRALYERIVALCFSPALALANPRCFIQMRTSCPVRKAFISITASCIFVFTSRGVVSLQKPAETPPPPTNGSRSTLVAPPAPAAPKVTETAVKPSQDGAPPPPVPKAVPTSTGGGAPAPGGASGGGAILARLKAERAKAAAAAEAKKKADAAKKTVTFVFASQTGTAEEIARSMHDEAVSKNHKSRCLSLNEWTDALNVEQCPVVVFIASTTGDGDPPDNSGKGLIRMKKKTMMKGVDTMSYTVMGLGDSNYTNFMKIPRTIDRKMKELGARNFYECKEADEVDGLEDIVDAWRDNIWDDLAKALTAGLVRTLSLLSIFVT